MQETASTRRFGVRRWRGVTNPSSPKTIGRNQKFRAVEELGVARLISRVGNEFVDESVDGEE